MKQHLDSISGQTQAFGTVGAMVAAGVFIAVFLSFGCSDSSDSSSGSGTGDASSRDDSERPSASVRAPAAPDTEAPTAANATEAPQESEPPDPAASTPAVDPRSIEERMADASFEEGLALVLELERDAEFFEALKALSELGERVAGNRELKLELSRLRSRLSRERARVGGALPHLRKLGDDRPEVREAAVERILAAGDVGFLLLRKEARNDSGLALRTALEVLVEQRDWLALESVLERLLDDVDAEAAPTLLEAGEALIEFVPQGERERFRTMFCEVYRLVWRDPEFVRRRFADLLLKVHSHWLSGSDLALNAYLRAPEAAVYIQSYVRVGVSSADPAVAAWSRERGVDVKAGEPALVGWWRFDRRQEGTVPDWSGNGHQGVIRGAEYVDGRLGGALRFDGRDDFVRISDSPKLSGGDVQASGSVLFRVSDPAGFHPLVEKQWGGTTGDWGLNVSGGRLGYYSEASGNDFHLTGGSIKANTWHHAVFVLKQNGDDAEIQLFLDGGQVAKRRIREAITADTDGDVYVGARFYEDKESKGYAQAVVDDVRFFTRALSPAAVVSLQSQLDAYLTQLPGGPEASTVLVDALGAESGGERVRILADALERLWRAADEARRDPYRNSVNALLRACANRRIETLADCERIEPMVQAVSLWFGGNPAAFGDWVGDEQMWRQLRERVAAAAEAEDAKVSAWAKRTRTVLGEARNEK